MVGPRLEERTRDRDSGVSSHMRAAMKIPPHLQPPRSWHLVGSPGLSQPDTHERRFSSKAPTPIARRRSGRVRSRETGNAQNSQFATDPLGRWVVILEPLEGKDSLHMAQQTKSKS